MSISPNPANEKIWCNINASFQNAILSITSLDGRIVFQTSKVAQNSFELDVSQLAAGAYLLVIDSDSGKWVKKFMKE